jgi:hypothetical protein
VRPSRVARLVTDVLAPGNVFIAALLVVGWHSTGTAEGLAWGFVTAVICGGFPLGVVVLGVRRRWWTDVHVSIREQRFVPLAVAYGPWLLTAFLAVCAVFVPLRLPVADEQLPARIDHRRFTIAMRAGAGFARRVRPSRCGNRCRPTS